ncbi:MAG: type II CRISPR RNA-guided endonuclease Cas9 [Phenylobacterium sp.]|nr:type II CRISPR RNA-guided endonuclease Cas9 [Phenylobacterium sp.]
MSGLVFGIDLGIASCGWAVLRLPAGENQPGEIVGMGSWMFDVPETSKERTPTNQARRSNRLLRRVIRRRAQRMSGVRRLFRDSGLITEARADALAFANLNPWELRVQALERRLTEEELAVALGHIAKRRGFKSSAKGKSANTAGDDQKMLKALEATQERLARYRTVGELFVRDPGFAGRKRNRDGIFDRTQNRDDLAREVAEIFRAQRRLGNPAASNDLEAAFTEIAFTQRPLQDAENLVGMCLFEPAEKRASRFAPSFERFRLLTRLVNLRVLSATGERPLTPAELAAVLANPGKTAKLSVKEVRKRIGLPADQRFSTFRPDEEDRDVAVRTGEAMAGTRKLRETLGETLWETLLPTPLLLDEVARVLTFFETQEVIHRELERLSLPDGAVEALVRGLESGAFAKFKGAAGISAKAARSLIPHLEAGLRYDQACEQAGYDHAASKWAGREQVTDRAAFNRLVADLAADVANPVARKSMTEGLKQAWAMRNRWGLPDAIHIEMARDVGNSAEKRREIERDIEKNTASRERERQEARELLGITDITGDTLLRYRLWKEQGGFCPYTHQGIPPTAVIATDNSHQVDHILPWSRFGDDSFANKVLCTASANQQKKGRTPFEWFQASKNEEDWQTFVKRIEGNAAFRGAKKRNYVLKNAREAEERFRSRNLNDTRYAARLLAEAIKAFYPPGERQDRGGIRRVFTRPGALTAALRQAWGVESLKKVDGKRVDDARHHALDALVVAAVGEAEVQRLTRSFQEWEQRGLARPLRQVPPPWGDPAGFRREVEDAYRDIFVARPERRRARGEGHAATIRQVRHRDGAAVVYERKAIADLKESRLEDIKDAERNEGVITAIRAWIARGRPADDPPVGPSGQVIRKVRLRTKAKPAVEVRGGAADRGEMVRVDVFSRPNRKGKDEFYLVPVYPHQVMNPRQWPTPPDRAVVPKKDEENWIKIDDAFVFKFSLFPRSHVELVKANGEVLSGYLLGMDRASGGIDLGNHRDPRLTVDDLGNTTRGIGAKTLVSLEKFSIDRFGGRARVRSEVRTWHGAACTSPAPPG